MPPEQISGCLELDEDFLRKRGVTDFSKRKPAADGPRYTSVIDSAGREG